MDDIITKWVLNENESVVSNLSGESSLLFLISSINTFLHDATSVLMASDVHTLVNHCIIKELVVFNRPALEDLLDYMVSVDVLAHFFDSVF